MDTERKRLLRMREFIYADIHEMDMIIDHLERKVVRMKQRRELLNDSAVEITEAILEETRKELERRREKREESE